MPLYPFTTMAMYLLSIYSLQHHHATPGAVDKCLNGPVRVLVVCPLEARVYL